MKLILVLLVAVVGTVCAAPFWNVIKWKDSKEKKEKKSESIEQPTVIVKRPMYGDHSVVHDYSKVNEYLYGKGRGMYRQGAYRYNGIPQGLPYYFNKQPQGGATYHKQPQGGATYHKQPQGGATYHKQPQGGATYHKQPQGRATYQRSFYHQPYSSYNKNSYYHGGYYY